MDILTSHSPAWLAGLVLALVVTGAIAGVLAGLLGVGGGIVIVPVLYHLFTLLGIDESVRKLLMAKHEFGLPANRFVDVEGVRSKVGTLANQAPAREAAAVNR